MAGAKKPGPHSSEVHPDGIDEGTMCLTPTPLPGVVGHTPAAALPSGVALLLQRLREAATGAELQRIAVALLGPHCFSAGVIAGVGKDILNSVEDLLGLVGTFVFADLYDLRNSRVSWWRYLDPSMPARAAAAELAGLAFGAEMKQAAEDRDLLIKELGEAFSDPMAFFEGMTHAVANGYKKDWQDYKAHMKAGTLEGQFRAGMIVGRLLVDIVGLITGVVGAAKAVTKMATKLPRLLKFARSLNLKPGLREMFRKAGRAAEAGGGSPKKVPVSAKPAPPEVPPPKKVRASVPKEKNTPPRSKMSRTEPTGSHGGKPTGKRTVNKMDADSKTKRALELENESADRLAEAGYKVEQNPGVAGPKNPDYKIEGKIFDNYAPTSSDPRHIVSEINKKLGANQTKRVVLNLEDSNVTRHQLRQALAEYGRADLEELIVIDKVGNIIRFFP